MADDPFPTFPQNDKTFKTRRCGRLEARDCCALICSATRSHCINGSRFTLTERDIWDVSTNCTMRKARHEDASLPLFVESLLMTLIPSTGVSSLVAVVSLHPTSFLLGRTCDMGRFHDVKTDPVGTIGCHLHTGDLFNASYPSISCSNALHRVSSL